MGKLFNRSTKKGKSIFDTSDDNAADSYGFIKEEQLPQNRSIRRRKMLTLALTVIFCAALFGIIASVVYRITSGVLDNLEDNKRPVDVRPSDGGSATPTPDQSEIQIDPTAFADIEAIYTGVRKTARAYRPCFAEVSAVTYTSDPVFGQKTAEGRTFFGVVIEENGTEYLLLVRDEELDGKYDEIVATFSNGAEGTARIVKRNRELHLAVIAVSGKGMAEVDRKSIGKVKLGDGKSADMGSAVVAIGCVNGTGWSVDFGLINGDSEPIYIRDNSLGLMQTNMVRHENAFGVLVNAAGEVVGILSEDFDTGNCLRAIAIDKSLTATLNDLLNNDKTPVFGAYFTELSSAVRKREGIKGGIRITEICEDTPADTAGFRKGDTILAVQDETIYYISDFNRILRREAGVGKMRVTYLRGGKEETIDVTITKE
ncbi:MAG: serine protease [Lachnospiraceae bacterium]|nr:serine protease [Lachnospiraceae bacterium]